MRQMTQIVSQAGAVPDPAPNVPPPSVPDASGSVASAAVEAQQPQSPNPADFRLVIEDDQAAGCFVYKTVDWATGQVIQQIPREQILKMREADNYVAGAVIATKA
jgi:flagellar protein FlaG